LRKEQFQFEITSESIHGSCQILNEAVKRFTDRIFPSVSDNSISSSERDSSEELLEVVEIAMNNRNGCKEKYPHLQMDEHYEIKINSPDEPRRARIIAFSVWGVLRGLESFSQLVYLKKGSGSQFVVNGTQVLDSPRFAHRGVLLDTSRHYIAKSVLKANLDLMEMNKFNVFHWHIVDDPSFPYESKKFPNMSKIGSFDHKLAVYTQQDIAEIIEYARLRGIRVVGEFDTPGHTQSFEPGHPGLLTECYNSAGEKNGLKGPMDPTKKSVYKFLEEFFQEVTQVFPDKYVHLGGDEVDFSCWKSNPDILKFMSALNISGEFSKLESIYIHKLLDIVGSLPTRNGYIIWQEVFDNNVTVKDDTVVHVWKGRNAWQDEMAKVTRKGLHAILSSPWYLNYISYGIDWKKYYMVDPLDFDGGEKEKSLVLGGEACMWGEWVNSVNLLPRLWPRASAVAEVLWSPSQGRDYEEARRRIQEMECRMLQRGFPVEPINGPAFCKVDWDKKDV